MSVKKRKYAVEKCLDSSHAKFQVDMSILGKHIAKHRLRWWRYFFLTAILCISRHRTETKMSFLESSDQTGLETHISHLEKSIRKFVLMWPGIGSTPPCPWLSWSQIAKLRLLLNSTCQSEYKSYAAGPIFFLFWWPFVTRPWPWPVLSTPLMLTGYLY